MRSLTLSEVIELHERIIRQTGGSFGVRDLGSLEAAVAQSRHTFEGKDLYASLAAKTAILCFSIIQNHPFVDGNKRVAHAAMETFLVLNGKELAADVDEHEEAILTLASTRMSLQDFTQWVEEHIVDRR